MSLPRLLTAIRALPPTPFRTTGQPQLFDALEGIVARTLSLPADAGDAAIEAKQAGMSDSMRRRVKAAEDALGAIEANKALDKYPTSYNLLHPAHDPEYYERMLTGVRRSQQGIGRSWWKRFFQVRGSA
ncbi:uncharacterized protein CcaverHIS019_0302950 [Cutaneotrichosporon cavernicola]|uniref:Uncharacterized protein n=1 Tax=Cutaneotrichosporon cavernicola TaxID=279322 RepID=A0AA48IAS3_9TREE|nr:uncharacterized protein CcaverHIS019_0302950 [Cutaneotrichosporon cavernicola]BEI90225.1 hypothetical protein CcaverHIS019_0302950 [Cutaneotrichosporon cavernicola]BEI98004.1 hypothetical protein CcaverHIS631_0303030 [Cutaneotrichosporon cavernicola]BEJ05780.1 hypothetical protein CcaverHIS641_0303020 [Cutaneotrichosporon cavernicola]